MVEAIFPLIVPTTHQKLSKGASAWKGPLSQEGFMHAATKPVQLTHLAICD